MADRGEDGVDGEALLDLPVSVLEKQPGLASDADWGALMKAAQDGDAASYRRLLGDVTPWLRRYYTHRLPLPMWDDAVQDVLIALHEKRHTYDPARPFEPWLAAIARHKWIDRLRAMRTMPTEVLDEALPAPDDHGAAVSDALTLDTLLAQLRPQQAEAIRLVKLEGLSVEEAALRARQSPSLVKVNIHRGLRRLGALVRRVHDAG
ncbi:sigma-70 family RNA polymerase sigma factor [Acetobacteraceae bacterium KSS8]|uniref:Sigma-70 family RNA polymerase sigma factor n=1 Tax=Endosaccharibacter trunci TaxID=2812733 RepID=A0ABT1W8S8_9PROT|nr:sigma-70 family RNA polymerase sigma factor [Acetobacteraceae bacterium KSS8]